MADPDKTPVLLTRPEAQSRRFAGEIEARFGERFEVVLSPMVEIRFLPVEVDWQAFDAVVFTSQNGVAAFAKLDAPAGLKAFCVGARTADAARAIGLEAVSADGDLEALNALLMRDAADARLVHISGAQVAGKVAGNVMRVTAYEQACLALNAAAAQLLTRPGPLVICLFSPQAGRWFNTALGADVQASLTAICLSAAVAGVLDHGRFARVECCEQPSANAMLDKMSDIFPPSYA